MVTSHRRLLLVLLLTGAAILIFLLGDFGGRPALWFTVEELLAQERTFWKPRVRVTGELVHGSLCLYAATDVAGSKGCEYRFVMLGGTKRKLPVHLRSCFLPYAVTYWAAEAEYSGVPVEAVFEGTLRDGYFEAEWMMVKCSAKYYPEHERKPRKVTAIPRCAH